MFLVCENYNVPVTKPSDFFEIFATFKNDSKTSIVPGYIIDENSILIIGLINKTYTQVQIKNELYQVKSSLSNPEFKSIWSEPSILELDRPINFNNKLFPICLKSQSNENLKVLKINKTNEKLKVEQSEINFLPWVDCKKHFEFFKNLFHEKYKNFLNCYKIKKELEPEVNV